MKALICILGFTLSLNAHAIDPPGYRGSMTLTQEVLNLASLVSKPKHASSWERVGLQLNKLIARIAAFETDYAQCRRQIAQGEKDG